MSILATRKQIRAYALTKPYATKVRMQRNGQVWVHGLRRKGGLGWYFLGTIDDLARTIPLAAADRVVGAVQVMAGRPQPPGTKTPVRVSHSPNRRSSSLHLT